MKKEPNQPFAEASGYATLVEAAMDMMMPNPRSTPITDATLATLRAAEEYPDEGYLRITARILADEVRRLRGEVKIYLGREAGLQRLSALDSAELRRLCRERDEALALLRAERDLRKSHNNPAEGRPSHSQNGN